MAEVTIGSTDSSGKLGSTMSASAIGLVHIRMLPCWALTLGAGRRRGQRVGQQVQPEGGQVGVSKHHLAAHLEGHLRMVTTGPAAVDAEAWQKVLGLASKQQAAAASCCAATECWPSQA